MSTEIDLDLDIDLNLELGLTDLKIDEDPLEQLWKSDSRESIDRWANSELLAKRHGSLDRTFPTHLASLGKFDLMLYCVESKGYDPNTTDGSGRNLLFPVVSHSSNQSLEITKTLIENHHANVNATDEFGDTPLHHAAQNSDPTVAVEIAKLLLAHGARIDARSKDGRNPFLVSLSFGGAGFKFARFIAEKDPASVKLKDFSGNDALCRACEGGGKTEAIEWLLQMQDGGQNVFLATDEALRKLFGFGADDSSLRNAELLIAKGARAGVSAEGNTLLHMACGFGVQSLKLAKLALETLNVDGKATNNQGRNALHLSCDFSAGDHKIVSYLLEKSGIDVNARDAEKKTALLLAVENFETLKNGKKVIYELIKNGAEIDEAVALAEQSAPQLVDLIRGRQLDEDSSDDNDEEDWDHGFDLDSDSSSDQDPVDKASNFNFDWD